MALTLKGVPFAIYEVERQAAELGTFSPIGAATEAILRGVAATAVADTEGTMNEDFEGHGWHSGMDCPNLIEGKFTGKHRLLVSRGQAATDIVDGPVVLLGGGVEREGGTHEFVRHSTRG